jgi:hypothetical protein
MKTCFETSTQARNAIEILNTNLENISLRTNENYQSCHLTLVEVSENRPKFEHYRECKKSW